MESILKPLLLVLLGLLLLNPFVFRRTLQVRELGLVDRFVVLYVLVVIALYDPFAAATMAAMLAVLVASSSRREIVIEKMTTANCDQAPVVESKPAVEDDADPLFRISQDMLSAVQTNTVP